MSEPYKAYVGFACSAPGPGAVAVVLVRGGRTREHVERFAAAAYVSDAILRSLDHALDRLADRADKNAPVTVYTTSSLVIQALCVARSSDSDLLCAVRKRFAHDPTLRIEHLPVSPELTRAAALAFEAAFPTASSTVSTAMPAQ